MMIMFQRVWFLIYIASSLLCKTVKGSSSELVVDMNWSSGESEGKHDNNDSPKQVAPNSTGVELDCGIWLAPSAIPGAGLGMYAGRDFEKGELLQEVGDLCIPIIDIRQHQMKESFSFLWDEYTWVASAINAEYEGFHAVRGASPGFGSVANSFLPVVNVDELYPHRDYVGLHRSKDPGAGAFTPYYDRGSTAERDIRAGEEFYVSYGASWFEGRLDTLGPIPLEKDLDKATKLFRSFQTIKKTPSNLSSDSIFDELWHAFIANNSFTNSRVLAAFRHDDPKELADLKNGKSLTDIRIEQAMRSQEWLQQYGTCGDHLKAGPSTLTQAGHGAFASRDLPQGTIVAQVPLIHVTNRSRFNMFHFSNNNSKKPSLRAGQRPPQILLNYCYGHKESTLLLCPYGPMVNYINHNQTQANVRIRWADPARGNFMPHLLKGSIEELETDATAKLAFELVATRNIQEGEEVFLDYGDEWDLAWQKHVDTWAPVPGAGEYRSVEALNDALANHQIEMFTEFDYLKNPGLSKIPANVELSCNNYFSDDEWRPEYESGTLDHKLENYEKKAEFWYCKILRMKPDLQTGEPMYTVEVRTDDDDKQHIWKDSPYQIFRFIEKPYTSDIFLPNAFRHDIRIPDEIFPISWRNLSPSYLESQ